MKLSMSLNCLTSNNNLVRKYILFFVQVNSSLDRERAGQGGGETYNDKHKIVFVYLTLSDKFKILPKGIKEKANSIACLSVSFPSLLIAQRSILLQLTKTRMTPGCAFVKEKE